MAVRVGSVRTIDPPPIVGPRLRLGAVQIRPVLPAPDLRIWHLVRGGILRPLSVLETPTPAPAPDGFVFGVTRPGPDNTGVPAGLTLTVHTTELTVTKPNSLYINTRFENWVNVQAADATFINCEFVGPPGDNSAFERGLATCTAGGVQRARFIRCTFAPQSPASGITGLIGHDYTAIRCESHSATDGFGVYSQVAGQLDCRTEIHGCYMHDLAYFYPDRFQSDNHTHNDGIQIQGPGGVDVWGNYFTANVSATVGTGMNTDGTGSDWRPSVTGQCVGITPNVKAISPEAPVRIRENWLDMGAQSVSIIPRLLGPQSGLFVTGNRFGRRQPDLLKHGVRARRAIGIHPDMAVDGWTHGALGSSFPDTVNGNTWEDTGEPVLVHTIEG